MRVAPVFLFILLSAGGLWAQLPSDTAVVQSDSITIKVDSIYGLPAEVHDFFIAKGLSLDSTSNSLLYLMIYPWMNVPYRYGGKGQGGIDCSGFVKRMFLDAFSRVLSGGGSRDIFEKDVVAIPKDSLREGDLVFFKIRRNMISHVGLYLSNNKFVHASVQAGVIISDLDEDYYRKFYHASGRVMRNVGIQTEDVKMDSIPPQAD